MHPAFEWSPFPEHKWMDRGSGQLMSSSSGAVSEGRTSRQWGKDQPSVNRRAATYTGNVRVLFLWPEVIKMAVHLIEAKGNYWGFSIVAIFQPVSWKAFVVILCQIQSQSRKQTCEHSKLGVYTYSRQWISLQLVQWRAETHCHMGTHVSNSSSKLQLHWLPPICI